MTRSGAVVTVALASLLLICVWQGTRSDPVSLATGSPPADPVGRVEPSHSQVARQGGAEAGGAAERTPALPPTVVGDPTQEKVLRAKDASGLGSLTDGELEVLVGAVVDGERSSVKKRSAFLQAGGDYRSLEAAKHDFLVEGWQARATAILQGSYALVPTGQNLLSGISGDPNLHVVVGPGGTRGDKSFDTHIIIDLRRHGRFAEAKQRYESLLSESDAAKATEGK